MWNLSLIKFKDFCWVHFLINTIWIGMSGILVLSRLCSCLKSQTSLQVFRLFKTTLTGYPTSNKACFLKQRQIVEHPVKPCPPTLFPADTRQAVSDFFFSFSNIVPTFNLRAEVWREAVQGLNFCFSFLCHFLCLPDCNARNGFEHVCVLYPHDPALTFNVAATRKKKKHFCCQFVAQVYKLLVSLQIPEPMVNLTALYNNK